MYVFSALKWNVSLNPRRGGNKHKQNASSFYLKVVKLCKNSVTPAAEYSMGAESNWLCGCIVLHCTCLIDYGLCCLFFLPWVFVLTNLQFKKKKDMNQSCERNYCLEKPLLLSDLKFQVLMQMHIIIKGLFFLPPSDVAIMEKIYKWTISIDLWLQNWV
mgnify:CR=1 FL=1